MSARHSSPVSKRLQLCTSAWCPVGSAITYQQTSAVQAVFKLTPSIQHACLAAIVLGNVVLDWLLAYNASSSRVTDNRLLYGQHHRSGLGTTSTTTTALSAQATAGSYHHVRGVLTPDHHDPPQGLPASRTHTQASNAFTLRMMGRLQTGHSRSGRASCSSAHSLQKFWCKDSWSLCSSA